MQTEAMGYFISIANVIYGFGYLWQASVQTTD